MTEGPLDDMNSSGSSAPSHWESLARYISGESSPEESARIEQLLAGSPADRRLVAELERLTSASREDVAAGLDVEAALAKVKSRLEFSGIFPLDHDRRTPPVPQPRTRWHVPMPALAAAAVLTVGIASWMAYENRAPEHSIGASPRHLATGVGIVDSIVLADGTRVLVGPLSSIRVTGDYDTFSRNVSITGNVWFDVVHDTRKPFTVHAGNTTITDVGTKFTVDSDDSAGLSVSVSEGAVSLQQVNAPASKGVILQAGDKALVNPGGQIVTRRGGASEDDIAWTRGTLVFRDAPLGEVVRSMHKWYGIEMKVADQSLAGRHLTATFDGESAERALEVIRLALGADIERRGDTAIVRSSRGSVRSR